MLRQDTAVPGTYKVSLEARTRDGSLDVVFGVDDYNTVGRTLTTSWQTLSQTFNVTVNRGRVFEIFETTANNPDWDIRNLSVQRVAPGSFTLSSGDGSSKFFKQTTPNFATTPSWITRYQTTTGTTFYALESQPGTQYVAEWLVLRQIGANYVAHYYTSGGSRVTFSGDGEYADFIQNPYQQLRGASASTPDPEGTAATTPKTEISYTSANSGLVSMIRDEWGRVTTYSWDSYYKTVYEINEAGRKTAFRYDSCFNGGCGNQRAVTRVTHTAPDGKGGTISRSTNFDYQWRANNTRLMLSKVSRSVVGNQNQINTVYTYDSSDRLVRVDTVDNGGVAVEPAINYVFTMTGTLFVRNNNLGEVTLKPTRIASGLEYRVPATFATDLYEARLEPKSDARLEWTRNGNKAASVQLKRGKTATLGRFNVRPNDVLELRGSQGAKVKLIPLMAVAGPVSTNVSVIQGAANDPNRKETRLVFDSSGQLTQKQVRDYNPWIPTVTWFSHSLPEKWLTTNYTYTATGSTSSIVSPAGRKDVYTYDAAGNVTKLEVFKSAGDSAAERSTTYTYNSDNQQTNEFNNATSGTRDGATYNYAENRKSTWFLQHTVTAGGQTFQAPSQRVDDRLIGGTPKRGYVEKYDTSGRLTQKYTYSSGLTGVITNFTYHIGTVYGEWLPNWTQGTLARQYSDLVSSSEAGNGTTSYFYNQFGDLILQNKVGSLASDINNSNQFVADRSNRKDAVTMRAYNGFGQIVMDRLYEYGRVASEQQFNYYATGELDSSWEGQPSNTTDYRIELSGANLGRVTTIVKGIGDGNGITTTREYTSLGYDAFGRVTTKTVDGFATTFKYDTLDRTVNTVLPNGQGDAASYHSSGVQDFSCYFDGGSSGISPAAQPDQNRCTYNYTIDGLGRPASSNTGTNQAGSRMTYFTYDPYDRPIRVYNDWLSMVTANTDRATYLAYDSEGNLTKQLGAVLGNDIYIDPRRPYTEYVYDGFNRKTHEQKLVRSPSPVSPSSMVMPAAGAGVAVARTVTSYDAWSRVISVNDADGWWWDAVYDSLGNVAQKRQQVCPGTTDECAQHFSDEDGTPDIWATTKYAYDAAGRLTATIDARGKTARTVYNAFGLPQYIVDARGVTTKAINYTGDGLVSSIYEPDNNPSTAANLANDSNAAGYVPTKGFDYGSRKFPTVSCVHGINNGGPQCTTYQYDFAGRPTLTTLPSTASGTATIEQGYDGRGSLTRLKDADGFATEYKYDAWGQLLEEKKLRRSGTVDMTALPGDLISTYTYDLAGNLSTKLERGLTTEYRYNSLGKVKAETRPRVYGAATNWKYYTYRVDGVKTSETSFDYGGSLLSSQYNTVGCWDTTAPNVTSGNVQCWELSSLGRPGVSASFGVSSAVNGGAYTRERIQWDAFNGLGLRYKRSFYGDAGIYAPHRMIDGLLNGAGQATLWRYDANGNLLKSYKRGIDGNGGGFTDGAVTNAGLASDVFVYTYTPTNKQGNSGSDVRAWANSRRGLGTTLIGRSAGTGGVATIATYTERDTLKSVTVQSVDNKNNLSTRITDYSYFSDGSKSTTTVSGHGSITYEYDARGRLKKTVDSNGVNGSGTPATAEYTYASDGTTTEHYLGVFVIYRYPTVGGLTGKTYTSTAPGFNGCATGTNVGWCETDNRYEYTSSGVLKWMRTQQKAHVSNITGSPLVSDYNTEHTFDSYGNLVEQHEDSIRQYLDGSNVKQTGNFARTRTYVASYSANNALQNDTSSSVVDLQGNTVQKSRSFNLTSRGMRLYASISQSGVAKPDFDTEFSGANKRYDADDRTSSFNSGWYSPEYCDPVCTKTAASENQRVMVTRYDPFGNLMLSVTARIQEWIWAGSTYQDIDVKSTSSYEIEGQTLLMHSLNYSLTHNQVRSIFWYMMGFNNPRSTESQSDKDETFSLADGGRNEDPNYSVLSPFAAPSIDSSAIPLAAPITPLSSQVRVEPSAIQAPGNAPPSSDPSAITAPSSPAQPSTTAAPQTQTEFSSGTSLTNTTNTTVASQGVSAPSVGVQSFSISGATTTATSSGTAQPAPALKPVSGQPTQQFSSQINLEPPSSVLPPSITPLSASSIAAPSSFTPVLPASGDVSSIVAPGASSVPTVGATPSSGTGTIVPPTSSVVPPGGSSGGIVEPGGGSSIAVKPLFNYEGSDGSQCDSKKSYAGDIAQNGVVIQQVPCNHPKNLDEYNARQQDVTARSQGDVSAAIRLEKNDAYYRAKWTCEKAQSDTGNCGDYVNRIGASKFYESLLPVQRVQFWQALGKGLSEGKVGEKGLQALTRFSMDFKLEQTRSGARLVYLGDPKNLQPLNPQYQVRDSQPQGYLDFNVGVSLVLGINVGVLESFDKGVYIYFGPTLGTPGFSGGITYSANKAGSGCFTQYTGSAGITVSLGQTSNNNADNFSEYGVSVPGLQATVSCAFTLIEPHK